MEKITQIRTPTNTLGRSNSPNSPRTKSAAKSIPMGPAAAGVDASPKPMHDLNYHVRQVKHALTHFKDVVAKNKLEMLSGNGTVVLETSSYVLTALKSLHLNENSNALISATTQVYVSLGKLIKLCDEVLLSESDNENNASLSSENVAEVVNLIDVAIQNLVKVANEQIAERNTLQRPQIDVAGQRTSLPDIPLTPSERDILEKSSSKNMRTSHSTESILRDSSPPPKPPLPHRHPPPLPPKRRSAGNNNNNNHRGDGDFDSNMLSLGLDRMSMRSRSPDDNSSLLSASSLDSALNHSREDDEIRALTMGESYLVEEPKDEHDKSVDKYSRKNDIMELIAASGAPLFSITDTEFKNQRNSNESGFDSMHSLRSSTFSTSTRHVSEQSIQQSSLSTATELLQHTMSKQQNVTHDLQAFSATGASAQTIQLMQHTISSSSLSSSSSATTTTSNNATFLTSAQSFKSFNMGSVGSGMPTSYERFDEFMKNGDVAAVEQPPALPLKTRSVSAFPSAFEPRLPNKHTTFHEQPPPLPVKKKHIMAYMEMFGNCSTSADYSRHSVHQSYNLSIGGLTEQHHITHNHHQISHSKTMSLSPLQKQTINEMPALETCPTITEVLVEPAEHPPALPPKRNRIASSSKPASISETPPVSPKLVPSQSHHFQHHPAITPSQTFVQPLSAAAHPSGSPSHVVVAPASSQPCARSVQSPSERKDIRVTETTELPANHDSTLIEELDIHTYLVLKNSSEEGPEVKGGYPDALIVHATQAQKNSESSFCEAFITTYRTFMTPLELIEKLIHRYTLFCCQLNGQKAANEAFSLLVRVVHDLTAPDLRNQHLSILIEFVNQLVCSGQLPYAKTLREQTLRKIQLFKQHKWSVTNPTCLPSRAILTNLPTLLELKSTDIAAQMTLLDADLFQKIEIPEVLIWAQEQCEERSPNLTQFTEHFNKMSYWARSQILRQEDSKDRERYVTKFIKIMKHLRKINNYNSYLALLSALDSAPIRRLEWHKTITEGLKEYCALIDSSSSFRAYRQALAETNPPCIPYIGLVLQDLTFVHIGNSDFLSDGVINFSKRWQQHNIVVNMKRFKKDSSYPFKKNERIISFFDNFENCLDEDAMWQISNNIKPRVARKPLPPV